MNKKYLFVAAFVLLAAAGYLYLRFGILRSRDFKEDPAKSESLLDLRPAIIARLQQLVKDGSNGLYILSIEKLEPDLKESAVNVINVAIIPDSSVLTLLQSSHTAPDDIVKVSFGELRIKGIGFSDLLHKDQIDLQSVRFINPVVHVYHKKKADNDESVKKDPQTLYQLLKGIKSIKIGSIIVDNGTFINHNVAKKSSTSQVEHIDVNMKDILFDSTTQHDTNRLLFAKSVDASVKKYVLRTADSLYFLKAGSLQLSAINKTLTAYDLQLQPREDNEKSASRKHSKDRFTIKLESVILKKINLYEFFNDERLVIEDVVMEKCNFHDFFNGAISRPASKPRVKDFPHQLLMRIKLPVYIKRITLTKSKIAYEEFNANTGRSGTVHFDEVNGEMSNITNMPGFIRKNSKAKFTATALFMNEVNFKADFTFDLKNVSKGNFTVDATLGKTPAGLINRIAEPLGLVTITSGTINKIVTQVEGDNYSGRGKILLLYDDLHIDVLKKDDSGGLKKRKLLGFLANTFLVKNSNPSKHKNTRTAECRFPRDPHGSFFNMIFKTILTGALKTIGLPEKLAYK